MSHAALGWAINVETTPTCKSVLLAIAYRSNEAGQCWPSVSRLMADTCLSERAVRASLGALAVAGMIGRVERNGASTVYTLCVEKFSAPNVIPPLHDVPPPLHDVPPYAATPAPDAPLPCVSCPPPLHVVHPPLHHVPPKKKEKFRGINPLSRLRLLPR